MLKFNHQSGLEVILTPVLAPGVKLAPGVNRIGGELLPGLKTVLKSHPYSTGRIVPLRIDTIAHDAIFIFSTFATLFWR